jgi:hypothetical protein
VSEPGGADTSDLRDGAPIQDSLLAVLPLVGTWQGEGTGVTPSAGVPFRFGQRLTFAHDGRPFLSYQSRAWLLDEDGGVIRPAFRETGFWRIGPGDDDIEAQVVAITGVGLTFQGRADDLRWELDSTTVTTTPTAKNVAGERRLYALLRSPEERLVYATELAQTPGAYGPHLNASLQRV